MGVNKDKIETLYESRFLKCYDLQYAEGKHYYAASRRTKEDLVDAILSRFCVGK